MSRALSEVFDGAHRQVRLARQLASGGEGSIYEVAQSPARVAKLYHNLPGRDQRSKVEAMIELGNESLLSLTAWPTACLFNARGEFVGFLMPKVEEHSDVHLLYSPKSRKLKFPEADWRFLLHTALNLAKAVATVHREGCVVGDLNHGNAVVSHVGTVKLIDCDSIQVTIRGRTYPCPVAAPLFTPPELQGTSLRGVTRTTNHDNFSLAVLVFHLLFLGRHPFAGKYGGKEDMPIERAIAESRFAYGTDRSRYNMSPPPHSVLLEDFPASVASLFERAFSPGAATGLARPSAGDWVEALDALSASVVRCKSNEVHYFVRGAARCPWCSIETDTQSVMFLRRLVQTATSTAQSVTALWTAIERVVSPGPAPAFTAPPGTSSRVSGNVDAKPYSKFAALLFAAAVVASIAAKMCWLLIPAGIFALVLANKDEQVTASKRDAWRAASSRWKAALQNWNEKTGSQAFESKRGALKRAFDRFNSSPATAQTLLEAASKRRFLESHDIETARLQGIGPSRLATLASFGIETAQDVSSQALSQITGFGPTLRGRLLDWKTTVEARYSPRSGGAFDPADRAAVTAEVERIRHECVRELSGGAAALSEIKASVEQARVSLRSELNEQFKQYVDACVQAGQAP